MSDKYFIQTGTIQADYHGATPSLTHSIYIWDAFTMRMMEETISKVEYSQVAWNRWHWKVLDITSRCIDEGECFTMSSAMKAALTAFKSQFPDREIR